MKKFNILFFWCILFVTINTQLASGQHQCLNISVALDPDGTYTLFPEDILAPGEFPGFDANVTPSSFTCFDMGSNIVIVNVFDEDSSIIFTCSATVNITDHTAPVSHIHSNLHVELDGTGHHFFTFEEIDNGSTDECSNLQYQILPPSVTCADPNPLTVSFVLTDESGNASTSTLDVTWEEYPDPTPSLACNDLVPVFLIEGQIIEVTSAMILEGGPYGCPDHYGVEISESGNVRPEPKVDFDDVGKVLDVKITDLSTGNSCWGHLSVNATAGCNGTFTICDTECRTATPGACNSGHTHDDNVEWPCDILFTSSCEYPGLNLTPEFLVSEGLITQEDATPEIIDSACYLTGSSYYDIVYYSPDEIRVERIWSIILWNTGEVWTYSQNIYISLGALAICDVLPWNTPFGDCASGHTDADNVEWPADITVHSLYISPVDIKFNEELNDEDAEPRIISDCGLVQKTFSDVVTQVNDSTLLIERTWTIFDFQNEWTFIQHITAIADLTIRQVCVTRENGEPIPGVELVPGVVTDETGCHTFENPDGIIVTPVKDSPLEEGVNLLDKILILEHILGIRELTTYQLRAADLSESASLTAIDVVIMNKILDGTAGILYDHNWKFFDATTQLHSADISAPLVGYKFIGVKMGDIDNSFPIGFTTPLVHINMRANDEILNNKEEYTVPFYLEKNTRIVGFTVQLKNIHENIDVLDILAPGLPGFTMEKNVIITPSLITIQWIVPDQYMQIGAAFASDAPLFSIHFKSTSNSILSEELTLQSTYENILKPIGNDEALSLNMNYENVIVSSVLTLANGQRIDFYPNPATDVIQFKNIAEDTKGVVTIVDATGKLRLKSSLTPSLDISDLSTGLFYISVTLDPGQSMAVPLLKIK
ncbi:MAG TPA: T9SS type A sorting domain-containing protein [Saprospiraceae bacterium]|nr:T9SS type A sorting domain-containing protein [Saprospiraceae bacterium]